MFLSVLDIFKIGIGPSSSHTMGPMTAAGRFLDALQLARVFNGVRRLQVTLHGSLAFTGKGHGTDRAVALGLLGYRPDDIDVEEAERRLSELRTTGRITRADGARICFDLATDLKFDFGQPLPGHPNGLVFSAFDEHQELVLSETYYSIGGGFVIKDTEADERKVIRTVPFAFASAGEMLRMAAESGLSVAKMQELNEAAYRPEAEVRRGIDRIWTVMHECIERGLSCDGELPGGLRIRRRAQGIRAQLLSERHLNSVLPSQSTDWLIAYAMAVNEENAAGGRVVTAPTNGAAGVVPAVLRYYLDHCAGADRSKISDFLLTAAAIGGLIKNRASISGAEAGCQGEVGSASAMAAAGLCAILGGSPRQVENAAEIALEHHLGMTCDPVAGLVQVPCIERNGMGAIKATAAASLALRGDGTHFMPLDNCIEAMRQTGEAMNEKFRETALGGLAVNVPEC